MSALWGKQAEAFWGHSYDCFWGFFHREERGMEWKRRNKKKKARKIWRVKERGTKTSLRSSGAMEERLRDWSGEKKGRRGSKGRKVSVRTERETGRFHAREEEGVLAGLCTVWPCLFSICCIPPFLLPLPSSSAARPPHLLTILFLFFFQGGDEADHTTQEAGGKSLTAHKHTIWLVGLRSAHLSSCVQPMYV